MNSYSHVFMTEQDAIENLNHAFKHGFCVSNLTCQKAIEALNRQIPKDPVQSPMQTYLCPICEKEVKPKVNVGEYSIDADKHCSECGQALKWDDVNP